MSVKTKAQGTWWRWQPVAGALIGLTVGVLAASLAKLAPSLKAAQPATAHRLGAEPGGFQALLAVDSRAIDAPDLATRNLLCAEGLPGAESVDLPGATATLEQWAERVKAETERFLPRFRRNPGEYQNSEAYFRILAMVTVLQQDFKVQYNAERVEMPDFADAGDLFLHGLLGPRRQGTCVSMPVLYVAVGRRLGYPLKLVAAKAHLFARWEGADGKERLNIEATNQGLNCFPDEYYQRWPVPMTPEETAGGYYLKSLTAAEELAVFLSARGHCLQAAGRLAEAELAQAQAHVLAPRNPVYLGFLASAVRQELPAWERVRVDLGPSEQRIRPNQ